MDKKEAETYLQTLTKKLSRIRNYIIANADKKHGKLLPAYQHAVRCTEAGTRELNRCFQIDYGSDGDLRAACLAEQHLKNRDRGDILSFHGRNHLVGVFTCQACDFDYVSDPNGGPPVRRPNSRLCVVCKAGVQHSAVIVQENPLGASGSVLGQLPPTPGSTIAPEPNMSDVELILRVYLCDSCAAEASLALEAEE
jgi:hypothetical protein